MGIAMGCTILAILFVMRMHDILDSTSCCAPWSRLNEEETLPVMRAFMDGTMILRPDMRYQNICSHGSTSVSAGAG